MEIKNYNAEEVAKELQLRGDNSITKRTINYYAFEKNMFIISQGGKKCFTEVEIDKIEAIRLLQTYTKLKLTDIKELINNYSLEEIKEFYLPQTYDKELFHKLSNENLQNKRVISVDENIVLLVSNQVNSDRIRKIVSQIKNVF